MPSRRAFPVCGKHAESSPRAAGASSSISEIARARARRSPASSRSDNLAVTACVAFPDWIVFCKLRVYTVLHKYRVFARIREEQLFLTESRVRISDEPRPFVK